MKPKDIQDLLDFISKSGLNEVNIETSEFKISVVRDSEKEFVSAPVMAPAPVMAAPMQIAAPAATPVVSAPAPAAPKAEESAGNSSKMVEIKSPMIGTFYRRPNPDSPYFANVGDEIKKGKTVCIIEAMKLFNEIESDVTGRIVKILVDDSTPVEYDQPLFLVEIA